MDKQKINLINSRLKQNYSNQTRVWQTTLLIN